MRSIGKQQFDISTPFSPLLMSTVAFMVIRRPWTDTEENNRNSEIVFCWLLGLFCLMKSTHSIIGVYNLHLLQYVYVLI